MTQHRAYGKCRNRYQSPETTANRPHMQREKAVQALSLDAPFPGKRVMLTNVVHAAQFTRAAAAASQNKKTTATHIVHFPSPPLLSGVNLSWLLFNHFTSSLLGFRLLACMHCICMCLRARWEEVLLEHYAQLFPDALELLEVLGVLALVLDLGVDACASRVSSYPGCRFP
jgi:hypothetical protein